MDGPNVVAAGISILRALLTTRGPSSTGHGGASTGRYAAVLSELEVRGPRGWSGMESALNDVVSELSALDPDRFDRFGAMAFWLDLYNAGALALAARTSAAGEASVLRTPGAFSRPFTTVAGERLSLDAIEHGKLRRFGDPRVHAAMVCGSVSCPTLRRTPYSGTDLDAVLDDQLSSFLAAGGLVVDRARNVVMLSRVFAWFGGDFVRPGRMPTFVPASGRAVLATLLQYVDGGDRRWIESTDPTVEYQPYDWGLRCSVG